MRKIALLCLALAAPFCTFADTRDLLISLPQVAKLGYGLGFMAVGIATFGEQKPLVSAALLAVPAAVAIPSGLVLWSAIRKDGAGTRLWRSVAFWVDAGLAVGALGLGLYEVLAPTNSNDQKLTGTILIVATLPLGVGAGVDLVPYSFEGP